MNQLCFLVVLGWATGAELSALQSPFRAQPPKYTLDGEGSGGLPGFGYAVDATGDIDGDGVSDLIAGAPYELVGTEAWGKARVYSGADGAQLLPSLLDPVRGYFGFAVAGVGDVNGDGVPDVAVGAPQFGGVSVGGKGYAAVRSGADGSELFRYTGDAAGDEFGYAVAGAGDVDLDGVPDWAVGATEDHELTRGPGYVRLFSGATGATLRTLTTAGVGRRFGQRVVNAGDANLDGRPDLLVSVSGISQVRLFSGASGALLWSHSGPTGFGWDADRAGDVDADGVPDLVVGAPTAGKVRALRASTGAMVLELVGPSGDFYGGAVAGVGDADGDGRDDLAIGAKWADGRGVPFTGAAWVVSSLTRLPLVAYHGWANGDRVGFALAGLGDVDHDGLPDFAIGANQEVSGGPGRVLVVQSLSSVWRWAR